MIFIFYTLRLMTNLWLSQVEFFILFTNEKQQKNIIIKFCFFSCFNVSSRTKQREMKQKENKVNDNFQWLNNLQELDKTRKNKAKGT